MKNIKEKLNNVKQTVTKKSTKSITIGTKSLEWTSIWFFYKPRTPKTLKK